MEYTFFAPKKVFFKELLLLRENSSIVFVSLTICLLHHNFYSSPIHHSIVISSINITYVRKQVGITSNLQRTLSKPFPHSTKRSLLVKRKKINIFNYHYYCCLAWKKQQTNKQSSQI
jgi:hypothetical protein